MNGSVWYPRQIARVACVQAMFRGIKRCRPHSLTVMHIGRLESGKSFGRIVRCGKKGCASLLGLRFVAQPGGLGKVQAHWLSSRWMVLQPMASMHCKKNTAVKLPRPILFEMLRSLSLTPIDASLLAKSA